MEHTHKHTQHRDNTDTQTHAHTHIYTHARTHTTQIPLMVNSDAYELCSQVCVCVCVCWGFPYLFLTPDASVYPWLQTAGPPEASLAEKVVGAGSIRKHRMLLQTERDALEN